MPRNCKTAYCSCGRVFPKSVGKHFSMNRNRWHRRIDGPVGGPDGAPDAPVNPDTARGKRIMREAERCVGSTQSIIDAIDARIAALASARTRLIEIMGELENL